MLYKIVSGCFYRLSPELHNIPKASFTRRSQVRVRLSMFCPSWASTTETWLLPTAGWGRVMSAGTWYEKSEEPQILLLLWGEMLQNKIIFVFLPQPENKAQEKLWMSYFFNPTSTNRAPMGPTAGRQREGRCTFSS